ncbi:MAG: hypothetical protein HND52_12485 [Ignavibacteriae bacterium]|nr:hypothetical protein [Ignavibacteriota bacterium]NOG98769.1 hypothetical protein [Ignavibacteriota bacterium]
MHNSAINLLKLYSRIAVLFILTLVVSSCGNDEPMFVGSKKSDKYHTPDCKWAKKIKPNYLIEFSTRSDAITTGYFPCKVCKP